MPLKRGGGSGGSGGSSGGGGKNWIQDAVSRPGALTAKAKAAGKSPMAFARANQGAPGRTGQQARLAVTLNKIRPGGKKGK